MNKQFLFGLILLMVSVPLTLSIAQRTLDTSEKRSVSAQTNDPTLLQFTILLAGIGNSGDSTNPNSIGSNKDPDLYVKHLKITFYDRASRPVHARTELLKFNYGRGAYIGEVELQDELPAGEYMIKVKVDGYLQRAFPLMRIGRGSTIIFPTVSLVAGDLNGNNRLDIIDYHILMGCYSDVLPPTFCYPAAMESLADLSSDGKINQKDYNLFMREINVHERGD